MTGMPARTSVSIDPRGAHAALDLDRLGAGLAQEDPGVVEGVLGRRVGQERHVGDDQRALRAAHDGLGVVDHLGIVTRTVVS